MAWLEVAEPRLTWRAAFEAVGDEVQKRGVGEAAERYVTILSWTNEMFAEKPRTRPLRKVSKAQVRWRRCANEAEHRLDTREFRRE